MMGNAYEAQDDAPGMPSIPAQRRGSDPVAPVTVGASRRRRRRGRTVLAVGNADEVSALIVRTRRTPRTGWRITAVCTSTGTGAGSSPVVADVPVIDDLDGVAAQALAGRYDAVAVSPTPGWSAVRLQRLATDLDGSRTALLVDHRLVPLAGPDLRVSRVVGLPLVRLERPGLGRVPRIVKGALDRLGALLALVLIAPLLLSCAAAVRRDGGPALLRRRRIGRGGREFMLLTFRTTDATGATTPVGRVLLRHCLDGLPQLFNVLGGSMSLVGPRPSDPPRRGEGVRVGHRLPLIKPGITGLWSGSDVRGTDLQYVTRWTPVADARILIRTVRAAWGTGTRSR